LFLLRKAVQKWAAFRFCRPAMRGVHPASTPLSTSSPFEKNPPPEAQVGGHPFLLGVVLGGDSPSRKSGRRLELKAARLTRPWSGSMRPHGGLIQPPRFWLHARPSTPRTGHMLPPRLVRFPSPLPCLWTEEVIGPGLGRRRILALTKKFNMKLQLVVKLRLKVGTGKNEAGWRPYVSNSGRSLFEKRTLTAVRNAPKSNT
jgi:hypothetical protein